MKPLKSSRKWKKFLPPEEKMAEMVGEDEVLAYAPGVSFESEAETEK